MKPGLKAMLGRRYLKMPLWLLATIGLFAAGGAIAWLHAQPQHAGWRYGACKAMLEQYVRYPQTIEIEEGGETRESAVLSFSDMNPFGARQIRVFECIFTQDALGQTTLSRVTVDRKSIPPEMLKKYADMLPVLSTLELDTALPKTLPTDLKDLKKD